MNKNLSLEALVLTMAGQPTSKQAIKETKIITTVKKKTNFNLI